MSSHAAPRRKSLWRTLTSARARALLSLGILLGFGAVGTSAYWTDQATVSIGPIKSGSLDLVLSPTSTRPTVAADPGFTTVGQGGIWTFPVVEIDDVLPGESVAMEIYIHNGGKSPLKFTGTGQSSNNAFNSTVSPFPGKLLISTTPGGTKGTPTGNRTTGNRGGSCVGGSANWWTNVPISTTPVAITPSNAPMTLQPNTSLRVCMLVTFKADAGNELQNANTVITATFAAVQP